MNVVEEVLKELGEGRDLAPPNLRDSFKRAILFVAYNREWALNHYKNGTPISEIADRARAVAAP